MTRIYEKLHVSSMTEAVAKAINQKLFSNWQKKPASAALRKLVTGRLVFICILEFIGILFRNALC